MATVEVAPSAELGAGARVAIRALLDRAFAGEFSDDDWEHGLGGHHVMVRDGAVIVAHASVVARTLWVGERAWRAGFVEAVGTEPARQGEGHGTRAMQRIAQIIETRYELGALSTGRDAFYEGLGWERWRGPTYVLAADGRIRSEADDGDVFVLRTGPSASIALTDPIMCEARPGDDW